MASKKSYVCPYCGKRFVRDDMIKHISKNHIESLPEGFTPLRMTFHIVNKKPIDYAAPCRICKKPTSWDEKKGRYNFLCDNPECKKKWIQTMKDTMGDKYGKFRPTATPEGLEKMLAARKISGKYKYSDGVIFTYTGSYELECLKFMDKVLELKSEDLQMPGPVMKYVMDNTVHYYIPDIYYRPYNLIIEVKDGGSNPNKNEKYEGTRKRQMAKEEYVIKHTNYNYLRLTDKDFSQLLAVFADLKMSSMEPEPRRVVQVNEVVTNFKDDFESKEKKSLSDFTMIKIDKSSLEQYKSKAKYLCHFEYGEGFESYLWIDHDEDVVGAISVKDGYIKGIEVSKKYQGYGLGSQILDYAIKELGGKELSVSNKNKVAIELYKKKGFKDKQKHENFTEMILEVANSVDILYHGSPNNLTVLKPKNQSYNEDDYVFATPDYNFALCYAGNPWYDDIMNQSYYNGQLTLTELKPNVFKDVFDRDGYIYQISDTSSFKPYGSSKKEYISKKSVVPSDKIYIKNVLKEIESKDILLYKYPNKPKWWSSVKLKNPVLKENYIEEAEQFKEDLRLNLDKWTPGNPLWITGSSGDGKSTLAMNIAKQCNALCDSTDVLLIRLGHSKEDWESKLSKKPNNKYISNISFEYIEKHPELPYGLVTRVNGIKIWPEWKEIEKYFFDFFNYFVSECKKNPKYKNRLIILEGCDICNIEPKFFVDKPLIILGGSRLNSFYQRMDRCMKSGDSYFDAFKKNYYRYDKIVKGLDDNKDLFRKKIETYFRLPLSEVAGFKPDLTKKDVLRMLKKYFSKYDPSQFVLFLNASLVMRGISKTCHDLDVGITKELSKQLEKDGYKKNIAKFTGDDRYEINDQFECFVCDFGDYEKIDGYNCSTIDQIKKTYRQMGRPKDLEKLKVIEKFERSKPINEFNQALEEISNMSVKENMFSTIQGFIPPVSTFDDNDIVVVNYLKHNTFSDENDYAVALSPKLDKIFYRDKGLLKYSESVIDLGNYTPYRVININKSKLLEEFKSNLNKEVDHYYIYESVFGHTVYTEDQIMFEENAIELEDYYATNKAIYENMVNYLTESYNKKNEDPNITKRYGIISDNGAYNACCMVSGYDKPMRERASLLVFKDDTLYGRIKPDEVTMPGGGLNKGESSEEAAIRETKEEARMLVKNVLPAGILIEYHETVKDWVKEHVPEKDWWYGYHTAIYIGEYVGEYKGKIDKEDIDEMYEKGKFYPINKIYPKLCKEYKQAVDMYYENKMAQIKQDLQED